MKEKTLPSIFREEVHSVLMDIESMLVLKNSAYGDSALNPIRVFSRLSPDEQIKVRIDDKLSRLSRGNLARDDEDVINDLIGYLVLLKISNRRKK